MSARAGKTSISAPEKVAKPAKERWKVHVQQPAAKDTNAETHVPAHRLRLAALQARPLPYRADLEAQFDADLTGILAYQGPEVDAALQADEAQAAVRGEAVLLPANADKPVVAHEVAHILQQRGTGPRPPGETAEAEALRAEALVAEGRPVRVLSTGLYPGAIAFRRVEELEVAQLAVGSDHEAAQDFEAGAQDAEAAPQPAAQETEAGAEEKAEAAQTVAEGGAMEAVDLGEPIPDEPVPTFEPAPMPEIEVDEAAVQAAAAQAEAALEGAGDEGGLMGAFKDAPPSVKALHHDQIEGKVGELATEDQAQFEADLPEITAEMSGSDDLAEPEPVATPESEQVQLEDGAPARPPEPQVDPTPDPGTADLNDRILSLFPSWFSTGNAAGLGRAFNNVSTADNEVETSAGQRPEVPLEGASNPQRVADQDEAAREDATAKRQEATQAVLDGPGPEQVELREVREEFSMEARETPQIKQAEGPVEGAAGFREKELDADVVALFDAHHAESMAASMDQATTEVGTAVETRNTERDAKVAETEAEKDRLNAEADEKQREEVGTRRQEVQDARQTAVDAQAKHVADVEAEADTQRTAAQTEIDTQVSGTETDVENQFTQAESEAEDEVHAGERQAEEERARQEREAEDLSWWERAANWVADQFDKLTKFINNVFDAVRSAVKGIIDAVKEAALALIDLAAKAIIAAIEALGEALKAAVNALLAEHFPEVAKALNDAIDSAVEVATDAVNAVAEGLKAAVSALLDALAAGLDAILAVYQAAVNAALAIARAALTGDWGALAKLILEPILLALGIQPAAFYEMIAKALEALEIIIDNPIGFLSNLVDAFTGGVRKFADNFLTHLQQGIIGWLTGSLGGALKIPEKFDLFGVLDLARQILGLTTDMIRRIAVRILGEEAVERIEFVMTYVVELVTGGFSALWEKIMAELSSLKDMVLDAIKSFLVERVIMAAITWLASLFSPVGALIKLVQTIWNFIMFLKDQLSRIIQVVQTIVGTMYEIATGVLEPAMKGVENVLARLLPIAIDLLARLLGLGNVAGKVKEDINNVRKAIEDAIVNLIRRVLAAFTGGAKGGAAKGKGEPTGADAVAGTGAGAEAGQIMAPIVVNGGGESHTLSIKDQGDTVVPMIASTPQPLTAWLDGRAGVTFENLADERKWRGAVRTNKKTQLEGLVAAARKEEAELDAAGEASENAQKTGPGKAQNEAQSTAKEGEQTKRALVKVLEFFGTDPNTSLADRFKDDIDKIANEDLQKRLRNDVLNQLDTPRYVIMDWDQARAAIPSDAKIPKSWSRPATSDGLLRSLHDKAGDGRLLAQDFLLAVQRIVKDYVKDIDDFNPDDQDIKIFLAHYLAQDLNQPVNARKIVSMILDGNDGDAIAVAMTPTIQAAADRGFGGLSDFDFAFKEVTGAYYKTKLVPNISTIIKGTFGKYFDDDVANANGGPGGRDEPLRFFLSTSKRASKNRSRLADSVRGADPGKHEWIPSSRAASLIATTADKLNTAAETDALEGLAKVLRFQHEVRTPTSDLIFTPTAKLSQLGRKVPYYSTAHAESGIAYSAMTTEQQDKYYPKPGPRFEEPIIVLQAHAGGLDAGKVAGTAWVRGERLQWASPEWHQKLSEGIDQPLADNIASNADGTTIQNAILDFYRTTIWRGAVQLEGTEPRFDLYFTSSDGLWRDYKALKKYAALQFDEAEAALETNMKKVFP